MRLEAFADVLAWTVIGLWILGRLFGVLYWFLVRPDLSHRIECRRRGVDPDADALETLLGRPWFWLVTLAAVAWLVTG